MSTATVLLLGLALPLWGSERPDMEANGFKYVGGADPQGLGVQKTASSPQLGEVTIIASLFHGRVDTFIVRTECSPERLTAALKTVPCCNERRGEYRCSPKEPTNPFAAKVCGNTIILWKEGDPETLRQANLGCRLAQEIYRREQEAKPDAGNRP
jgi:hypothetical protein